MCGRYTINNPLDVVAGRFDVASPLPDDYAPRYNAAPLQRLPVIRWNAAERRRQLDMLRWGLVPSWSRDPSSAARMINARCETLAEKASFKAAFRKRRCIVPASAFYEWKAVGKTKQPYAIGATDNGPFAMAALWEGWKDPANGEWLHTFSIITTAANALIADLHDRMPVILPPSRWATWLGKVDATEAELVDALQPYDAAQMRVWSVLRDVGNVRNDRPLNQVDCLVLRR